jgi:ABC-type multidrug transport system ATPase subunit
MTTQTPIELTLLDLGTATRTSTPTAAGDRRALLTAHSVSLRDGDEVRLHETSLAIAAGELVAIAGPSGAGKTTLMRVLGGVVEPTGGRVSIADAASGDAGAPAIGYVPQDDIVPVDLTVEHVLRSAAELVLDEPRPRRAARVDRVLRTTGLSDRRGTAVRDLSGGERKRVNVAIELLTEPRVLLLDEPTSGLDPGIAAALLDYLRSLAGNGSAVVVTTHAPEDIRRCDRVVFVARGGHVVYDGAPSGAAGAFGVDDLADVYAQLEQRRPPASGSSVPAPPGGPHPARRPRARTSVRRQWWALTKRNAMQLSRNRLTLAVLLGSPALVTAMMVLLFSEGALSAGAPMTAIQLSYWLTFSAFFFGLTYGLLQIVTELAIVERDRRRGVGLGSYLGAKAAVLIPILAVANVTMLGALRATGRLPALEPGRWIDLLATLTLVSLAALATGLLASAAVRDATQATLALPMICFPQVLFAGLLIPRGQMTGTAEAMSNVLLARWGFEAAGRSLGVADLLVSGVDPYASAFSGSTTPGWAALIVLAATMAAGTVVVLRARTA